MKQKNNKKSLAYKISKYDLQDEVIVLFLGSWVVVLSILFLPDVIGDKDEYAKYYWFMGAITILTFMFVALKLLSRKIKIYRK